MCCGSATVRRDADKILYKSLSWDLSDHPASPIPAAPTLQRGANLLALMNLLALIQTQHENGPHKAGHFSLWLGD